MSLGQPALDAISDPGTSVHVSAVSVWEIAIKVAKGQLSDPPDMTNDLVERGFEPLPITFDHAAAAGALPPHHKDPFDRMLIAQARIEGLTIVTRDKNFAAYDVTTLTC